MRVSAHPCFILHSRAYRETSLLLDIFSREHGRLTLIAKGAKKNKQLSHTYSQPYQLLNIAWTGKGELPIVTSIELHTELLFKNTEQMLAGFYINELLMKLLHKFEANSNLFEKYYLCLAGLADGKNIEFCLRIFEKHLLLAIGYALILEHDVNSHEKISSEADYCYDPFAGPVCYSLLENKKQSDLIISGKTLLALEQETEEGLCLKEAKLLMRTVLQQYLGEQALVSRKLYKAYQEAI